MVKVMNRMEGYQYTPNIYTQPLPGASEQGELDTPIEQPASHVDLNAADVSLSAIAQYLRELQQRPQWSPAAEAQIVEQARSGDQAAKHQLIEDRLPYIMHMAIKYHVYAEHEDLLDIVGVANLAVTANIDKALSKDNPAAYLCGVARGEIKSYCFYHSRLMPIKDHHMPLAEAPTVVSLDEQRADIQYRYIESLAQESRSETDSIRQEQIYHALDQLPDHQREVVERYHGLHGGTYEAFPDIARSLSVTRPTVYHHYHLAIERLGKLVAESMVR
jgi:RNA polymerase sigma factor (sigma-70 family)